MFIYILNAPKGQSNRRVLFNYTKKVKRKVFAEDIVRPQPLKIFCLAVK